MSTQKWTHPEDLLIPRMRFQRRVHEIVRYQFPIDIFFVIEGLLVRWWPKSSNRTRLDHIEPTELILKDCELNDDTLRALIVRWRLEGNLSGEQTDEDTLW